MPSPNVGLLGLRPGLLVAGRFLLEKELGRGGMGAVWRARHKALDVPCAVKFIIGDTGHDPELLMRFDREAKSAAQLRSAHVVQILDYGVFEATPYIAMEYLDGEDLARRIARKGRLELRETYTIISHVVRALTKAHGLGVVHRDLKPENVFLCRDGDGAVAKVLDFGIAKRTATLGDSSTRTGTLLGTPYYMSPEQARGVRAVDPRADLWSLAVITYQCLTGSLPFVSEALGDLLVQIMFADLPVPTAVNPVLPQGFDEWWKKAAGREPENRFQTAKELQDALATAFGYDTATALAAQAEGVSLASVPPPPASVAPPALDALPAAERLAATESAQRTSAGTLPSSEIEAQLNAGAPITAYTPSPTSRTLMGRGGKRRVPVVAIGGIVVAVGALVSGVVFVATRDRGDVAPAAEPGALPATAAMAEQTGELEPRPAPAVAVDPKVDPPEPVASASSERSAVPPEAAPTAKPAGMSGPGGKPRLLASPTTAKVKGPAPAPAPAPKPPSPKSKDFGI